MQISTIETGGVSRILDEHTADVIVLRGDALHAYVAAVTLALGRPLATNDATTLHGVRRRTPNPGEPIYRDTVRDWFVGEPMPESVDDVRHELQAARWRIAKLEKQLADLGALVEAARGVTEPDEA